MAKSPRLRPVACLLLAFLGPGMRGDEIISINNRKITDLKGGMKPGSDLSDLLVNQLNGRVIYLEVAVRTKAGALTV